jgi:hypothetical protein
MYKTGFQLGQKALNERRKMAMQSTMALTSSSQNFLDYDTTRRIYANLMATLQS